MQIGNRPGDRPGLPGGRSDRGSISQILTARDLMTTSLLTFQPDQTILSAMQALLKHGFSGAPVVSGEGALLGVLSELDCLRMLASDEFFHEHQEEGAHVEHFMTRGGQTIEPELGIYAISHYFLTKPIRRLPVVERGRLIGQISRRDVLRGIETLSRQRAKRTGPGNGKRRYPDYLQPA